MLPSESGKLHNLSASVIAVFPKQVGELVKAGLVHILRVSMDSSTKDILQAAAACLSALLSSQEQEALQDWLPSSLHPALAPVDPLPSPVEEMADQALVEADTVLGLVRMDLVERSAYLLSRKDTEKTVIVSLLTCLVRVARHSKNMASKLASHRIVTTLLSPHMPYLPVALKLVRVICAQSRELAQVLLDRLRLEATMAPLLARESTEMEEVAVCVEAHRLWVVLLAYGQTLSLWDQLAPVVLQRLVTEYRSEGASSRLGAWVIEVGGRVAMCRQVDGLEELLANCLRKWLGLLSNCDELGNVQRAVQVAAAARALGRLYQAHIDKEETELGPVMGRMETLLSSTLLPFLASPHFVLLLSSLKSNSGFLSGLKTADVSPPSLPGLGLAVHAGALHPAVAAPHVLLLEGVCGLLALVRQLLNHFWQPPPAMAPPHPTLVAYLTALSSSPSLSLTCHPLSRGETHLVHHLLRLYSPAIPAIAHSSALTLASLVQTGDSNLLQDLFDNYIFSPSLLSTSSLSTKFSSLALAPSALLPASGQPGPSPSQVLEESLANLPSLRAAYASLLSFPRPTAPEEIQSLSVPPDTLLPSDWAFLPLLSLYHSSSPSKAPLSPQQVQWALAWLALLPPSPPTPTFLRLSTLFLSPGSLFLLPPLHSLLHLHLCSILARGGPDLALTLPGVSSNLDLYQDILEQFTAESYGDQLFSLLVIIAVSMSQPAPFRRLLWGERPEALALITLAPCHTQPWTLDKWLQPPERDPVTLMGQFKAVVEGVVRKERQPLLHSIATHHINHVLIREDVDEDLQEFKQFLSDQFQKHPPLRNLFTLA